MNIDCLQPYEHKEYSGNHVDNKQDVCKAAQQFEGMMFRQLLNKALKPLIKSELIGETNATDTYRYLFVDTLAQSIASTSPLHLDTLLTNNLCQPKGVYNDQQTKK